MLLDMMCHEPFSWNGSVANGEVERLNLLVSANGSVLRSEILGALKMKLQPEPSGVYHFVWIGYIDLRRES